MIKQQDDVEYRNSQVDNYKTFLIFLVVLGHFLIQLRLLLASDIITVVYYWIYLFHMPAFIFISVYLSKGYAKRGGDFRKLLGFLVLYVIFKLLIYTINQMMGNTVSFSLFYEKGAPWYLLAMFWYYLLIPVISKLNSRLLLIVASVLTTMLIPFYDGANSFLALTKTINFLPFFLLGYYYDCTKERLKVLHELMSRKISKFLSWAFLVLIALMVYLQLDTVKSLEGLMYGDKSFGTLGFSSAEGICIKLLYLIIVTLMIICSLYSVPFNTNILSYIGSRTLAVYIGHILLRPIIFKADPFSYMNNDIIILVFVCIISFAEVILLSWKPFSIICNSAFSFKKNHQ